MKKALTSGTSLSTKSVKAIETSKAIKSLANAKAKNRADAKTDANEQGMVKAESVAVKNVKARMTKTAKKAKAWSKTSTRNASALVGELTNDFVALNKVYNKEKLWNPAPTRAVIVGMIQGFADYDPIYGERLNFMDGIIRRVAEQAIIIRAENKSKSVTLNSAGHLQGPDKVITPTIYNRRTKAKTKNQDGTVRNLTVKEVTALYESVSPAERQARRPGGKGKKAQKQAEANVGNATDNSLAHLNQLFGANTDSCKKTFDNMSKKQQESTKRLFQRMLLANVDLINGEDAARRLKERKAEKAQSEINVETIKKSHEEGNRQVASN
jgi:hypothetical protein|tara:strand:+ start:225 stop:1202 length:978 start_codon:yes stop_codon:yes gene_type:complete